MVWLPISAFEDCELKVPYVKGGTTSGIPSIHPPAPAGFACGDAVATADPVGAVDSWEGLELHETRIIVTVASMPTSVNKEDRCDFIMPPWASGAISASCPRAGQYTHGYVSIQSSNLRGPNAAVFLDDDDHVSLPIIEEKVAQKWQGTALGLVLQ